jgi:hypothetical protein
LIQEKQRFLTIEHSLNLELSELIISAKLKLLFTTSLSALWLKATVEMSYKNEKNLNPLLRHVKLTVKFNKDCYKAYIYQI